MEPGVRIWLALSMLLGCIVGQSITASNWTSQDANAHNNDTAKFTVSLGDEGGGIVPLADVVPLVSQTAVNISASGLVGPVVLANYTNELSIGHSSIAVISCDASAYPGNIDALDVFGTAEQVNATGILWYSTESDWCVLEQYSGSYGRMFSMKSRNDTQTMLDKINNPSNTLIEGVGSTVYMSIGRQSDMSNQGGNSSTSNGDGSGNDGNNPCFGAFCQGSNGNSSSSGSQTQNPLGPSPSTAVAMIILYSITGIITALFLAIIITGAVRAHRHPERYGPRNLVGRARQSRARGLARAMLDTIPIVKFGEREEPKPTDVELADSNIMRTDAANESGQTTQHADIITSNATRSSASAQQEQDHESRSSAAEDGIAAATATRDGEANDAEHLGCSICTDDFELGQDQRVLPCNHRFHPACIDPWLLNVSGTCPLCRIDLRPQISRSSVEPELDEHGNPILRDEDGTNMPPPLGAEGDARRTSVRRSIMLSLMGVGRPDRLTREERVLALRQYRAQQAVRRRREEQEGVAQASDVQEEESGLRTRLRNAFRVRTRRTELEEAAPETGASQDASARGNGESPSQ